MRKGWGEALDALSAAGVIGVGSPAHMMAQDDVNRHVRGMMNVLSLDAKVVRAVAEAKRLLQDITMSERRVHASNVEISTGMGDSTHLSRQRLSLLKTLDHLIHLTGNERIAEFRRGCMAYLEVLENRREAASKYRHGQYGIVLTVATERQVDAILQVLLEFVPADFGAKPEPKVKPRRGILRSLFTREERDPTEWYLKHDFSR